jgi:hypothetical protein
MNRIRDYIPVCIPELQEVAVALHDWAAVADIAFEELRRGPFRYPANRTLITFANAMEGQFLMEEYYS